jgi:hypothetical protein
MTRENHSRENAAYAHLRERNATLTEKRAIVTAELFTAGCPRLPKIDLLAHIGYNYSQLRTATHAGTFYEGKQPFQRVKSYLTKRKGRTPLQCPPPNNQTNQPLASGVWPAGKTKNPSGLWSEAVIYDATFFKLFKTFCFFFPRAHSESHLKPS